MDGRGPSLRNVEKLDMGAIPMINHMAATGMVIDPDHFVKMQKVLRDDMDRITEKVYRETGYRVNLGSGDQVSDMLFNKMGLKQIRPKMTDSGSRESVAYEVLAGIQHQHPVVGDCIEFKEVEKLLGTYAIPIPKLAKKDSRGDYRLHPNFGTTRIPSSRFNCKEPNMLAMPNKTDRARELCQGFIPQDGWVHISIDASQIEPRTVAHRSRDPKLCSIYENGEDIYSDFAIAAFKIPDKRYQCGGRSKCIDHNTRTWHYPDVDKVTQRFPAKTCVLASIYNVTGAGLAEQMPVVCRHCSIESKKHREKGCTRFHSLWQEDNCQDLINKFFMEYEYITRMYKIDNGRARKHTLVWDDWGRIMHTTAVRSIHPWVVSAALRELNNFPIQSTAMGTLKLVMAETYDGLKGSGALGEVYNPLLPEHDELFGEVREDCKEEIGNYIKDVFENCVRFRVPIKAEMKFAENWGSLEK